VPWLSALVVDNFRRVFEDNVVFYDFCGVYQ